MKTTINEILRYILVPGLLSGLLACQGTSETREQDEQTVNPPVVSETAAPVETPGVLPAEIKQAGLTGQVIVESDVSGQPDEPLAGQMVLAIPVEKAGKILGAGTETLTNEKLRFLKASLPQADPAISVTLSDAAGTYTLLLDPGQVILCVADSEKTPPGFPAKTRGCGRTLVPPGELRHVDVSSGFGEILLVER